jgi:hypothetical protein
MSVQSTSKKSKSIESNGIKTDNFSDLNKIIDSKYYDNVSNALTTKDLEVVEDLLFKDRFAAYKHQYESYNQFIDDSIVNTLKNGVFVLDEEVKANETHTASQLEERSNQAN